jgi:hypothetical protein
MRKNDFSQPRVAASTLRALSKRRLSWHPAAAQSLIAVDPAHWSQRHQQATSWLLMEFLQTQRNLQ